MIYEKVARPVLFRVGGGDAEAAHEYALRWLARTPGVRPFSPPGAATTVFGVRFPNPVGLAAGMDKDGRALHAWPALGFGFVEVGTVTWHPQPGDRQPDGLRQRGCPRPGRPPEGARAAARTPRRESGKVEGDAAARGGRRLRRVPARAVPLRRLLRRQRVLTEHPWPAHVAGPRPPRRAARGAAGGGPEAAAGEGRAGPDRRGTGRGTRSLRKK